MLGTLLSIAVFAGIPLQSEAANLRCPVTGFPVANRRIYKTVEAMGRNYRVFDRRAGILLKQWPAGYLDATGEPLNARSPQGCCTCDPKHGPASVSSHP